MKMTQVMKSVISLILCIAIGISTGCASIVSKSEYPVSISSNPSGAVVTIKDKYGLDIHKATTPSTVGLSAGSGSYFGKAAYTFEFEKEGYLPAGASLSAGFDAWYIGNIVFGWWIGWFIVDPITGAMWKLNNRVYANLSPDPEYVTEEVISVTVPTSVSEGAITPACTPATGSKSIEEQLKSLKGLYDDGLLSKDEYETKRKALVDKL